MQGKYSIPTPYGLQVLSNLLVFIDVYYYTILSLFTLSQRIFHLSHVAASKVAEVELAGASAKCAGIWRRSYLKCRAIIPDRPRE
jgi:hypothetical protein